MTANVVGNEGGYEVVEEPALLEASAEVGTGLEDEPSVLLARGDESPPGSTDEQAVRFVDSKIVKAPNAANRCFICSTRRNVPAGAPFEV